MSAAETLLGAVILLPLLGALVTALVPKGAGTARRKASAAPDPRAWAGLTAAMGTAACSIALTWYVAAKETAVTLAIGGWDVPLGLRLLADGTGAMFVALTGIVGAAASVVAAVMPGATGSDGRAQPAFWPLWLGCWTGLNTVYLSGDIFNAYVGLELAGLTAVGLVALGGRAAWAAAFRYLVVTVVGSMLFLVAVGLIVSETGTLDFRMAAEHITAVVEGTGAMPVAVVVAVLLGTAGMALKFALAPLHGWLIPAHSSAPSVVSPLLSALVIKAPLLVLFRLWLWVADDSAALTIAAWILGAMGAAALLWGSVMALRQTRLKKLVAYSTVAQAGYWVIALPVIIHPEAAGDDLPGTGAEDTVLFWVLTGTMALIAAHGLAKAALFLVAGLLKERYGTDDLDDLAGAGRAHPALAMTAGLAAVTLAGLPPSLAFGGKWQLVTGAVMADQWWLLGTVVVSTLLSAGYLLRILAPIFRDTGDDGGTSDATSDAIANATAAVSTDGDSRVATAAVGPPIPVTAAGAALALAVLSVAAGFAVVHFDALLQVGGPS